MKMITVNESNIEKEHICCAITDKKGETCVSLKKAWLSERFSEGLVFKKMDVRGKVFIELIPAESAWVPVDAPGYLMINCFWVSGRYKGQGHGDSLLKDAERYARDNGFAGLLSVSSIKKKPFLSDPGYLMHRGFLSADRAEPWFSLLYLPFDNNAPLPRFKDCCRAGKTNEPGTVLYFTDQCPFTDKYARIIERAGREQGHEITLKKIRSIEEAQNAPTPFTTYSLFHDGQFVTNEILSGKKFLGLIDKWS